MAESKIGVVFWKGTHFIHDNQVSMQINLVDDWQLWWCALNYKWNLYVYDFIFWSHLQSYNQLFLFWIMEGFIFIKGKEVK